MQPGVVYTTFHHFGSGVNVVTTDFSDWATNCPEYKVTAVQVRATNLPSEWQVKYAKLRDENRQIAARPRRSRHQGLDMTAAQPLENGSLETEAPSSQPSPCGEGNGLPQPTAEAAYQLLRRDAGSAESHSESVAEEVPVAMVYNGLSHVVMMASPTDLEDFCLGFSLTEGIIDSKSELTDCEISRAGEGIEARIEISSRAFFRLKEHRRALQGRTGCGLCGVESLDQALRDLPKLNSELRVRPRRSTARSTRCPPCRG